MLQAPHRNAAPPNHPKLDGNRQIGKTGRYNAART
jgi:hypothetical protein